MISQHIQARRIDSGLIAQRSVGERLTVENRHDAVKSHALARTGRGRNQKMAFVRVCLNTHIPRRRQGGSANSGYSGRCLLDKADAAADGFTLFIGAIAVRQETQGAEVASQVNAFIEVVGLHIHGAGEIEAVVDGLERNGGIKQRGRHHVAGHYPAGRPICRSRGGDLGVVTDPRLGIQIVDNHVHGAAGSRIVCRGAGIGEGRKNIVLHAANAVELAQHIGEGVPLVVTGRNGHFLPRQHTDIGRRDLHVVADFSHGIATVDGKIEGHRQALFRGAGLVTAGGPATRRSHRCLGRGAPGALVIAMRRIVIAAGNRGVVRAQVNSAGEQQIARGLYARRLHLAGLVVAQEGIGLVIGQVHGKGQAALEGDLAIAVLGYVDTRGLFTVDQVVHAVLHRSDTRYRLGPDSAEQRVAAHRDTRLDLLVYGAVQRSDADIAGLRCSGAQRGTHFRGGIGIEISYRHGDTVLAILQAHGTGRDRVIILVLRSQHQAICAEHGTAFNHGGSVDIRLTHRNGYHHLIRICGNHIQRAGSDEGFVMGSYRQITLRLHGRTALDAGGTCRVAGVVDGR